MSSGVKALVGVLCILLILSVSANFLLLQGKKENSKVASTETLNAVVPTDTPSVQDTKGDSVKKEVTAKKDESEEELKPEKELIINGAYFWDANLLSLTIEGADDVKDSRVEIDPAVKGLSVLNYNKEIEISGEFVPGTLYSVVVYDGDRKAAVVVTAPDHRRRLKFNTCGTLFPLYNDYWNLPVSVENLNGKAMVKVYQAYSEREVEFLKQPSGKDFSKVLAESVLPTQNIRNKEQKICLNLEEIGIPRKPGLYKIELYDDSESYWCLQDRTLIVTDLGVMATYAADEVVVAVRSLKDCSPVPNARVQIFSQKLWEYYHAETDENGFCRLPIADAAEKEDFLAYLVVTKGEDRVYANLERSARMKGGAKAAVFPERGICRPGETMRVFASLRDKDLRTQGGVPLEFRLKDPKGNVVAKDVVTGDAEGLYEYDCVIPANAFIGRYSLLTCLPAKDKEGEYAPYGSTSFFVGEYIPDQIKLSLAAKFKADGMTLECAGKAEYYFGMPLSGTTVTISVEAECGRFAPKGFEDYTFGCYENNFGLRPRAAAAVKTGEDGSFGASLDVSECAGQIATPVRYYIESTTLPNAGGRSVSAHQVMQRDYAEYYVGAMKDGDDDADECVVGIIGVTPAGEKVSLEGKGLKYCLKKYNWEYVLKRNMSDMYERIWQRNEEVVAEGKLILSEDKLVFGKEIGRGEFVLQVKNGNDISLCDLHFWHWGGESGARLKDPTSLVFQLDKENYHPGETAIVTFESPMEGSGIVMPGLNHLAEPIAFSAKIGRNEIAIPIPADLNNGSWFAAVAVACRKNTASDPILLKGMVSLVVLQDTHRLKVTVETPEECRPSTDMEVNVRLADSNGNPVAGEAIIWGVDMGILSLTAYKTPDIFDFFFGEVANPLIFGNNYDMLYPVVNAGTEKIGGGFAASMAEMYSGKMKEHEQLAAPAIFHLGIVKTDENGTANAIVRLPEHTGTLNVMAIAAERERTGSGASEVILRRETSLLLTVPRVVAPEDEFQIVIQGFNHNLEKGDAQWKLSMDGEGELECANGDFMLDKGGSATRTLRVKAGGSEGRISFKCTMTLGDVEASADANVVVRQAIPNIGTYETIEIAPGETKEIAVGEYGDIEIGSTALAVSGGLKWLADYPYGCLEQVTAAAMPMLVMQNLVDCGVVPAQYALGARNNILKALADLSVKRKWNGWMSMWNGDGGVWVEGSLFAYLFLFEAAKAGYTLDSAWRAQIVENLKTLLNKTATPVATRVFANYLLTYAEPQTAVKYLKLLPEKSQKIPENADEKTRDAILQKQCDGFDRFLVAMTRIKGGYAADGARELEKAMELGFVGEADAKYFGFDSAIRREGIALWMLCDVMPEHPAVDKLCKDLLSHRNSDGHWGTTQENAWTALGLARYCAVRKIGKISGTVIKDGKETNLTSPIRYAGANSIAVKNTGDTVIAAFVRDWKVPEKIEKVENGLSISKEMKDMNGNKITKFKRGELVRVTLKVRFNREDIGNYVICDLLPGCLEIEDEQLATRSHATSTGLDPNHRLVPDYVEKRYDRFLCFGASGMKSDNVFDISYVARVVTTGVFTIPPVSIESMYHPNFKAVAPFETERMISE